MISIPAIRPGYERSRNRPAKESLCVNSLLIERNHDIKRSPGVIGLIAREASAYGELCN